MYNIQRDRSSRIQLHFKFTAQFAVGLPHHRMDLRNSSLLNIIKLLTPRRHSLTFIKVQVLRDVETVLKLRESIEKLVKPHFAAP